MYLAILEVSVESDGSNPDATPLHQPYLIRTAEFGVERKSLQCTDFFPILLERFQVLDRHSHLYIRVVLAIVYIVRTDFG